MIRQFFFALFLAVTSAMMPAVSQADDVAMTSQAQTININTADATALAQHLKGVGQSRAEAIVRYREDYGPFYSLDDLLQVKGVGQSIVDKNRDRITLE